MISACKALTSGPGNRGKVTFRWECNYHLIWISKYQKKSCRGGEEIPGAMFQGPCLSKGESGIGTAPWIIRREITFPGPDPSGLKPTPSRTPRRYPALRRYRERPLHICCSDGAIPGSGSGRGALRSCRWGGREQWLLHGD